MPKFRITVAILAVVMLLLLPTVALAQPNVCGFYGSVMLDGQSVVDGTVVKAMVDGEVMSSTTTEDSTYSIKVAGEELAGKSVLFIVESDDATGSAEVAAWEAGANKELDLNAISEVIGETKLTLKPSEGVATNVCGEGFTPYQPISITWNGQEISSTTASGNGQFCTAVIPPTNTAGNYVIAASDPQGRSDDATFKLGGAGGMVISSVTVNTISPNEPGSAEYDSATGVLTLNIPKGEQGNAGPVGADGEDGSDASSVLGIVALIIAIIAVILAVVFGIRGKQPAAS